MVVTTFKSKGLILPPPKQKRLPCRYRSSHDN
jgi:hypothetical protein